MDEVFGNSSTETVISVKEFEKKKKKPSSVLENIDTDGTEEPPSDFCSEDGDPESEIPFNKENISPVRVSVITSVGEVEKKCSSCVFKVPLPPSGPLRHAQSSLVQRPVIVCHRIRSRSTSGSKSIINRDIPDPIHSYQNIPRSTAACSLRATSLPQYVNLPETKIMDENTSHSAPSTPRGTRHSSSAKVNSSYIQLWTGTRQDENNKVSGTGYVSMSSPYVRSPNSSVLSDLAGQLSSYGSKEKLNDVFCPFCSRPFTTGHNLKHHIQAVHRHELQKIVCSREPVFIQYCPQCCARFLNLNLLPGHLLEFHREAVVDILVSCGFSKPEDKETKCPFCYKKIEASNFEDVLLFHVAQVHSVEYEECVRVFFQPVECIKRGDSLTRLSTEDLAQALSFKPGMTSTPGLSLKFRDLSCENNFSLGGSHSNLEETWSSHCMNIPEKREGKEDPSNPQGFGKGILRSQTELSRKQSVKRELRFSVPPVTSEEFFIPESPEGTPTQNTDQDFEKENSIILRSMESQNIPVRVDSLSSADFIELNNLPCRKRRRLGVGLRPKKAFKKKKKNESNQLVDNVFEGLKTSMGCSSKTSSGEGVVATSSTRSFRKPKASLPPTAAPSSAHSSTTNAKQTSTHASSAQIPSELVQTTGNNLSDNRNISEVSEDTSSPFGNMKLYSPLRMFRCNSCRLKFCDNDSLGSHIRARHRGLLGLLRPQYGCGICSAKFYENKYLVKHCLQHHTSLLEIRSPKKHKITIYRFSQD